MLTIKTKLFPPANRDGVITRPGLSKLLRTAGTKKLVLVHAPAGYGKTTLLYEWHKSMPDAGRTACWLSLDELDDDPTTFVRYVLCAYQEVINDFWPDAANWMEGRLQPDITIALNHIINELIRFDKPVTLFMDDYQHINSIDIHQFIERLIDWSPENFILVVGSRIVPPLSLSKWRVSEKMTEVDVSMLRFSRAEAETFLQRKHALRLTEKQIATVTEKSEGWAAGLQLVALVLKNYDQRDEFIASFSGNLYEIADYLTNNVLIQQSQSLIDFLLKTSILSRFNADICNLLTGRSDSQSILEQLENDGLFTLPLDTQGHWYRHHHLFHDFLIGRLRRQYPHEVLNLYRTAAGWFRARGLIKEAVDYALHSNDLEIIEDIHRDAIAIMSLMGTTSQVYTWLSNIPDAVKQKFPRLLILEGFALCLMNRVQDAESINTRLEQALTGLAGDMAGVDPEELTALETEAVVVPASIAAMKDDNTRLLALTEQLDDKPVANLMIATLNDLRGYAQFRLGRFAESKMLLGRAWQYFSMNKQCYGMAVVDGFTGIADIQQLNYQEAYRVFQRSEAAAKDVSTGNIFAHALASIMRATICYEWNRIEEAQTVLHSNLQLLEEIGPPIFSCYGYVTLSRCYSATGDWDAANNTLNRCLFRARRCESNLFPAWVERERLLLAGKIRANAARYSDLDVNSTQCPAPETIPKLWDIGHYFQHANLLRLGIMEYRVDKVSTLATNLRNYAEQHAALQAVLDCLLLEAQILELQDNRSQAVNLVRQAVSLAEPAGLLRTFIDEGETIKGLLDDCLGSRLTTIRLARYIETIMSVYNSVQASGRTDGETAPQREEHRVSVEALSKRELEVLQLVSAGKTNTEIAEQLFIANATVKFHVGNIFSKLHVTNRTLAVATARNSGLIN